ncbi:hypothetical protein DM860_002320 [Cuscuta australis]|uniref:RRM domain-containing protein n=1 Tax=Cuscuta australis TaxID=267555 RepID=A0A328CY18_9ASTE|nr:hypothetical protein DM860_002320 [Cuscuta australis]
MASSISTTIQTLNRPKSWPATSNHLLRLNVSVKMTSSSPSSAQLPLPLQSHFLGMVRFFFTKKRSNRIAVAEVEAAAFPAAEEEEDGGGDDSCRLYVGNLPYNCDSAQLAGLVHEYATPELVEVLYDRETGKSRGFAFVRMSSIEDCNAVIKNLDRVELDGRILRVNFSNQPQSREPLHAETEHKIFVGNLEWSVTSDVLRQSFEKCGNVVGARVLYNGETGRSRGYGFVSYETRGEMELALESLNGMELEGRGVRLSIAEGRKNQY